MKDIKEKITEQKLITTQAEKGKPLVKLKNVTKSLTTLSQNIINILNLTIHLRSLNMKEDIRTYITYTLT
jgi:hypothetical protein